MCQNSDYKGQFKVRIVMYNIGDLSTEHNVVL